MRTILGAVLALAACVLAMACDSDGGGSTCFSPVKGPSDTSCAGFDADLSCPVDLSPWYTCVCTQTGSTKTWVCSPADSTASGGGRRRRRWWRWRWRWRRRLHGDGRRRRRRRRRRDAVGSTSPRHDAERRAWSYGCNRRTAMLSA